MIRPTIRAMVRSLLDDESGAPLWSDAAINAGLGRAMLKYGGELPQRLTVTIAATAGLVALALPAAVVARTIAAVRNPIGNEIPKRHGLAVAPGSGYAQSYHPWAALLRLQAPVAASEAGAWSVDYWGPRFAVEDDTSEQPIDPGDEHLVALLTAAQLVARRQADDAKRGRGAPWPDFLAEARAEIAARKRRVRASVFTL